MYRFHETVRNPVRTIRDRQTFFETRTELWGEFNLAATVRFKDGRDMKLERYLNL
jgi:transcription initiation factor IIF auxiliary subunit